MKVLSLVNQNQGDINYRHDRFPDGQNQICILNSLNIDEYITIKSRLNNWIDLEKIVCATASLRELGVKNIHLYTPHFMGARSDRKFEEGSNNYLRDIICPVINSLEFESVTVLDPHSNVLEACLKNFKCANIGDLYDWCYKEINFKDFVIIQPDAGASKRTEKFAKQIRYQGDIITCSKTRGANGAIKDVEVEIPNNSNGKDMILLDDILDYGGTFVGIAKKIYEECENKGYDKPNLYLVITHSIQDEGLQNTLKHFKGIYTTNSYKDRRSTDNFKQLDIFK